MAKEKSVNVQRHKKSSPKTPSYKGKGNKPDPKTVDVKKHKKSTPS